MPIHDQRFEGDRAMGQAQQKHRAVLIVEDDPELRSLTAALLKDEEIDAIECESAEAALAVMLIGGQEVAMIFADIRLPGVMDGVDLSWEVKHRWPLLPIILTSGHPLERIRELPPGVAWHRGHKPWVVRDLSTQWLTQTQWLPAPHHRACIDRIGAFVGGAASPVVRGYRKSR